jgi:glycosidase
MLTQDDIIYFVVTDRFCPSRRRPDRALEPANPRGCHGGDFSGLKKKIPYFQRLGITAVWITPVYLNIGSFFDATGYHGYWAMDFERVDPRLSGVQSGSARQSRAQLKKLVTAFHQAGLKVVLDMVVNHTGYHTPEYLEYPERRFEARHFNRHREGDPVEGWLSGLPDLDHDQPEVGDYFVQNILDWIEETGIDAIRMDTVKHVEDAFWYLFKSQVKTRHPQVTLIGEVLDQDPGFIGRYQQQNDFDTLFDFPLCGALKQTLVWDQPMTRIARPRLHPGEAKGILDQDKPYTNANRLVTLLDNHDLERRITTEILDRTGDWDRDLAGDILRLSLSLLLTTRGIPQIYYGTEIGLEGRSDPDNRRDMPWALFGPDQRPKARHRFEREVFDHLCHLIGLRKAHPAIGCGYLFTLYVDQFIYAYLREFRGDLVLVAINNGREAMPYPLRIEIGANPNLPPRVRGLLADGCRLQSRIAGVADALVGSGGIEVQLPRKAAGIFTLSE